MACHAFASDLTELCIDLRRHPHRRRGITGVVIFVGRIHCEFARVVISIEQLTHQIALFRRIKGLIGIRSMRIG